MTETQCDNDNQVCIEFGTEADPFFKSRQKGAGTWIFRHIFFGRNSLFVVLWLIFAVISTVTSSLIMFQIGDTIQTFADGRSDLLVPQILIIFTITMGNGIFLLLSNILREYLAQRLEVETRREFYLNLIGKSQSFHDEVQIGEIMARATSDVRALNWLVSPALSLIFESLLSLLIPLILITRSFSMQLLVSPVVFVILFIISVRQYFLKLGPITKDMRFNSGQMHASLNETFSGIEVVKELVRETKEKERYLKFAEGYRSAVVEEGILQARYYPFLIIGVIITAGLIHSLFLLSQGQLNIGQVITYVGLLTNLRRPTRISIWTFSIVTRAITSAERLVEFMNKKGMIGQNLGGIDRSLSGKIEFRDVSFKYPMSSNLVLKNISFVINPGETVALVGTTGSGKTTLTKLISRLYDITKGEILIDDIAVQNYALDSLRSQISYIEQDVFLFRRTILENISFGRAGSQEEIEIVAKSAQAHEFIMALKNGYNTNIGEQGIQLSGGERQRIAIARAFLSNPKILILDDSTSAIDSKTEDKIQRAIKNILQGRTTFIITHRLGQIRWADKIIVLHNGNIVAQGTHHELIKTCEEYRKIFVKRFDKTLDELLEENQ